MVEYLPGLQKHSYSTLKYDPIDAKLIQWDHDEMTKPSRNWGVIGLIFWMDMMPCGPISV